MLVQCKNALYGTMVASILFYSKFTKSLKEIGFKQIPYDPCIFNTIIVGLQMNIYFHMDDCKLSHCKKKSKNLMIKWIHKYYKIIFEDGSGKMALSRGNVHMYLGVTLDYRIRGRVNITMLDYIEEIITAFEKAAPGNNGTTSSAAPINLFVVDKD